MLLLTILLFILLLGMWQPNIGDGLKVGELECLAEYQTDYSILII